jgi:hypothetical protein
VDEVAVRDVLAGLVEEPNMSPINNLSVRHLYKLVITLRYVKLPYRSQELQHVELPNPARQDVKVIHVQDREVGQIGTGNTQPAVRPVAAVDPVHGEVSIPGL